MNAWGAAFGSAWGRSWGDLVPVAPPSYPGAGTGGRRRVVPRRAPYVPVLQDDDEILTIAYAFLMVANDES